MGKRSSVVSIKIEWTPGAKALKGIFPDEELTVTSAARMRLTAQLPFDVDDLDSFGAAQADAAAVKATLVENGTLHSFAAKITTVAGDGTMFDVGDDDNGSE